MTEGKIVQWFQKEGDAVRRGDPLLEIETDKANMEVEAPADGVLRKIFHREGEVVPVLTPIAVVAPADETLDLEELSRPEEGAEAAVEDDFGAPGAAPSPGTSPAVSPAPPAPAGAATAGGRAVATAPPPGRIAASPVARRLARSHGIDLAGIRGSGPRGRIIRRDVESALSGRRMASPAGKAERVGLLEIPSSRGEYPSPSPRPPRRIPLTGMRKAIAKALQSSKVTAPHYYATMEIDMTAALALRRARVAEGLSASVNDVLVRAVARALADEPRVNCRVSDEAIEYPTDVNIGIAVGLEDGLVVPVLMQAQKRSLAEIAVETERIIDLARKGKLVGAGQGTFTISNLGMFGIKCFTAVINPPEGAILAVGKAVERVVPAGGGFVPRMILEATLSSDHRAIDGLLAARFLARLRHLLEEPERIF